MFKTIYITTQFKYCFAQIVAVNKFLYRGSTEIRLRLQKFANDDLNAEKNHPINLVLSLW